jgi:hypothetical protein
LQQAAGAKGFAFSRGGKGGVGDNAGDGVSGGGGGVGGGSSIGRERQSRVEVLEPGIVCLRRAIDLETQAWLADTAFEVGESGGSEVGPDRYCVYVIGCISSFTNGHRTLRRFTTHLTKPLRYINLPDHEVS